jgi:DNA primase
MTKIPEHTIERIKDSNDIVDVIASYLPMKKKGANYWARCPFHDEKTASFSVSPSKQIFHCFGCGAGGNVLNFVMDYEKLSFIEAVKQLAERANIQLDLNDVSREEQSDTGKLREMHEKAIEIYHHELFKPSAKKALDYLLSRGLSESTIKTFKLGYAPESWDHLVRILSASYPADLIFKSGLAVRSEKDGRLYDRFRERIMFPVHDERNNAVGFGGRIMTNDKKDAKYLNSPETPIYNKRKILYGLHITRDNIRHEKKAIVVEGYMDFLQLYQHGYLNVVAGSGTAFTDEHGRLLRRFANEAILCYDSDVAGQKAAVKTGFTLSSQKLECRVLSLPEGEDPDSFLHKHGTEEFLQKIIGSLDFIPFLRQYYQPAKMSARQKSETITQLLEEIRIFSDPVYREMFAREIAKLFSVEEQTLLDQLNRQQRYISRDNKNVPTNEKPKQFKNQGESAEYYLLQLIVNGDIIIRKAGLRYLSVTLFKHPFLSQVLAEYLNILHKNIHISPSQLPDKIKDEKVKTFTYKICMEDQNPENQKELFVESLKQIELQMLKDEYNLLTEQLNEAAADEINVIIKQQMANMQARKQLGTLYNQSLFEDLD